MYFDPLVSWLVPVVGFLSDKIKKITSPTITANQRANKELLDKDIIKGVPYEQIQQNIKNGKYRLPPQTKKEYPEPHRDPSTGKIIIENCTLYNQDLMNYNGYQVMEWAKQGKYNLSPAELEKEREKYKEKQKALSKKYANKNINDLR